LKNRLNWREAWQKLSQLYDTQDQASQLARRFAFMALRMRGDESVANWIARVEYEAAQCSATGVDVSNETISVLQ